MGHTSGGSINCTVAYHRSGICELFDVILCLGFIAARLLPSWKHIRDTAFSLLVISSPCARAESRISLPRTGEYRYCRRVAPGLHLTRQWINTRNCLLTLRPTSRVLAEWQYRCPTSPGLRCQGFRRIRATRLVSRTRKSSYKLSRKWVAIRAHLMNRLRLTQIIL